MVLMLKNLARYEHLAPVLLRLGVGLTFVFAGYGKATGNMDGLAQAFTGWGIPMPTVMAPFIAYLELLGGIALLLGLGTRLIGLLFTAEMFVAIIAARWSQVIKDGAFNFGQMRVEWLLLLGALTLACIGAGRLSLDAILGDKPAAPVNKSA